MQEVIRVIQGKKQRQMKRQKISDLTPQQLFNNMNYHKSETRPHKILKHQYQHLASRPYNNIDHLTDRKMYPLSYVFAYQPLRANQMEEERIRSKSIGDANQFLRDYDPVKYQKMKEDYLNRMRIKEKLKEDQQRERKRSKEDEIDSDLTSDLVPLRESRYSTTVRKRSKYIKQFRSAGIAIMFIMLVKKRLKKFILRRKQKCLQWGKMYVQQASYTMQTHYYNILQQQITQYILLLQKVSRYPSYNSDSDILRILTFITQKLNTSIIPKSLLQCLELIAMNHTFINFPFLFHSQIVRLQINQQFGCLANIGQDQSLMIGGCLMGIVMLCYNLLYRPWLASNLFTKKQKRQFNIENRFDKLKKTIHNLASIIYFTVIDQFVYAIEEIQCSYYELQQLLKKCGIQLVSSMNVQPKYFKEEVQQEPDKDSQIDDSSVDRTTSVKTKATARFNVNIQDKTSIILDQNRKFYIQMRQKYPQQIEAISQNLCQWISKSTLAALSQYNRARRQRVYKFVSKVKRNPY